MDLHTPKKLRRNMPVIDGKQFCNACQEYHDIKVFKHHSSRTNGLAPYCPKQSVAKSRRQKSKQAIERDFYNLMRPVTIC